MTKDEETINKFNQAFVLDREDIMNPQLFLWKVNLDAMNTVSSRTLATPADIINFLLAEVARRELAVIHEMQESHRKALEDLKLSERQSAIEGVIKTAIREKSTYTEFLVREHAKKIGVML